MLLQNSNRISTYYLFCIIKGNIVLESSLQFVRGVSAVKFYIIFGPVYLIHN